MKALLLICTGFLLLATASLPIGYYTFLRIVVTICSVAVLVNELEKGITIWIILFGLIAILFNPIFPIYLGSKKDWLPLDISCAILFVVKAFSIRHRNKKYESSSKTNL